MGGKRRDSRYVYKAYVLLLPALTAPQPHRLPVFLQFCNQLVALLDHVGVLLVLVIGPVGLDDALDPVDGAGYAVRGDEFGQVPVDSMSEEAIQ